MLIKIQNKILNPDRIVSINMEGQGEDSMIVVRTDRSIEYFQEKTFELTVKLYEKLQQVFGVYEITA